MSVYRVNAAPSAAICFCNDLGDALTDQKPKETKPMKTTGGQRRSGAKANAPEWATGLRRLYDSVVEEPLPDSFARLLDQLDDDANG